MDYLNNVQGTPMILLHGLFGNLSNWSETINHFKYSQIVLAPTLPLYDKEFGHSGLSSLVEYLKRFLDSIKIKSVILVGNSLGGHVALLFTIKYPHMVEKLVLAGSSGLYENATGVSYPRRNDYNYIKERVEYTFHNPAVATTELVDDVFAVVNDFRKTIGIVKIARSVNKSNVEHLLSEIKIPTQLMWGKQDKITPLEVAYKFHLGIRNSELKLIDHCGHVPMMEQPEIFNHILEQFLTPNNYNLKKVVSG